jgi:hypothetical protein
VPGRTLGEVTPQEAQTVADAWAQFIVFSEGSWAGDPEPFVGDMLPIAPQGTVVGYFFPVSPIGYIVVPSDNREAPVKVWSDTCDLDPDAPGGMAALIRDRLVALHALLNPAPQAAGAVGPVPAGAAPELEIDYGPAWDWMLGAAPSLTEVPAGNYGSGQILLTSTWGQGQPYNNDCPYLGCTQQDNNGRAVVGCVATAGAQIMRYWCWPPYGVSGIYADAYDWANMPNYVTPGSPAVQQAAIAEISHEIGVAVDMDYGCAASSAITADMEGVYEGQYRYSSACQYKWRSSYTAAEWFNRICDQLNANRPLQYRVVDHSIVADGWRVSGGLNQYHMNYGWYGSDNGWYTLDALKLGNDDEEYVVEAILPQVSLGPTPAGTYARNAAFPYRYFDRDALSTGATFSAGQNLQSLPRIVVECTSGTVRFDSTAALWTRLFNRGDITCGARLTGGTIKLRGGGCLQQQ